MRIDDKGISLACELTLPEGGAARPPLAIVLHGLTGYKEEPQLAAMARMMNGLGCAVLCADLYGHGESGGAFRDHTVGKWVSNILALLDHARSLDAFSDIWLCGHSQGGLAVFAAAVLRPGAVRGIIAMAPALSIPERARRGELFGNSFDPGKVPDKIDVWGRPLDGAYILDAQQLHAEEALAAFDGPVLFLHGCGDDRVPPELSVRMAALCRSAEVLLVDGADHDFGPCPEEAAAAAGRWLNEKL